MIRTLAHVCFYVRSIDASLAFYRDALGLPVSFHFPDAPDQRPGLYLHTGDRTFIELFEGDHEADEQKHSYRHFCFEVDDLHAAVATLRARGIEVTDPARGKDRTWLCWLIDPDGNRVQLQQYTPECWQMPSLK